MARTGWLTVQLSWEKPPHFKQALVLVDSRQGETEGTVQAWLWLTQGIWESPALPHRL